MYQCVCVLHGVCVGGGGGGGHMCLHAWVLVLVSACVCLWGMYFVEWNITWKWRSSQTALHCPPKFYTISIVVFIPRFFFFFPQCFSNILFSRRKVCFFSAWGREVLFSVRDKGILKRSSTPYRRQKKTLVILLRKLQFVTAPNTLQTTKTFITTIQTTSTQYIHPSQMDSTFQH